MLEGSVIYKTFSDAALLRNLKTERFDCCQRRPVTVNHSLIWQTCNNFHPPFLFLSQSTTLRAGGGGLYIENGIQYSIGPIPLVLIKVKFMLWVEIESDLNSNMMTVVWYTFFE